MKALALGVLLFALHQADSCHDLKADGSTWRSSTGSGCVDYKKLKLCTTNGQPGEGWDVSFGSLSDWATAGLDATQVLNNARHK
jgi:hypothetical protein